MAKPVAGEWVDDEFAGLRRLGVDRLVSLLEFHEQHELGLANESRFCEKHGMLFSSFPIPDRGFPDMGSAAELVESLFADIHAGEHAVVHCRGGIGRSGLIASAILIRAGHAADRALQMVSEARGVQIPDTEEQEHWVRSFEVLNRDLS